MARSGRAARKNYHDLGINEDGVELGDDEVVDERRAGEGDGDVRLLLAGGIEPEVGQERRHRAVAKREDLLGLVIDLGVRCHLHGELAAEIAAADCGDVPFDREPEFVGKVGLCDAAGEVDLAGEEAGGGVGAAGDANAAVEGPKTFVSWPRGQIRPLGGRRRHFEAVQVFFF